MFEINLVPDIKADMLRKQRMANLVLFISIIVAAASAGIVLLFGSIVGGQNIAMANQDTEIACRSKGAGNCGTKYGTAVLKFANINDFLTIQDQMKRLDTVNTNKMLLSRVFGVLDVLLPTGEETVAISELNVDLASATLTFEAQGDSVSNIDYKALEVFKKSAAKSYFDYGRYMRTDADGSEVEIPTACITETVQNGLLYGIYHKGTPGCEAPLIPETTKPAEDATEESPEEEAAATDETTPPAEDATEEETTPTVEIADIPIRRTYASETAKDAYKDKNDDNTGGYFFESKCITYGGDGNFSEDETIAQCPLIAAEIVIRDSSNGRDSNNRLVLRFNANVSISANVFKFNNKHMRVVGPSRQNVTDSYTQIRDMFTEKAADCDPTDTQCIEAEATNGGQ